MQQLDNIQQKNIQTLFESDYLEDVQYDWIYTLRHWIDNHACNVTGGFTDIAAIFPNDKTVTTSGAGAYNLAITTAKGSAYDSSIFKEMQNNKQVVKCKTYSPQKGTFKYNCCKLTFPASIKRKRHELEWHTATKLNGL